MPPETQTYDNISSLTRFASAFDTVAQGTFKQYEVAFAHSEKDFLIFSAYVEERKVTSFQSMYEQEHKLSMDQRKDFHHMRSLVDVFEYDEYLLESMISHLEKLIVLSAYYYSVNPPPFERSRQMLLPLPQISIPLSQYTEKLGDYLLSPRHVPVELAQREIFSLEGGMFIVKDVSHYIRIKEKYDKELVEVQKKHVDFIAL